MLLCLLFCMIFTSRARTIRLVLAHVISVDVETNVQTNKHRKRKAILYYVMRYYATAVYHRTKWQAAVFSQLTAANRKRTTKLLLLQDAYYATVASLASAVAEVGYFT